MSATGNYVISGAGNVATLATDATGKTNAAKSIAAWHGINVIIVAGRQK